VLAKSIGLSWDTTKAILLLADAAQGRTPRQLEQCLATYAKLNQTTARKALEFYRLRERAAQPRPN